MKNLKRFTIIGLSIFILGVVIFTTVKLITSPTWQYGVYLDKFGDPTDKHFMYTNVPAYMEDRKLPEGIEIRIKKYRHTSPPSIVLVPLFRTFPFKSGTLYLKNSLGVTLNLNCWDGWYDGEIYISDFKDFMEFLKETKYVQAVLVNKGYGSDPYSFKIDAEDFLENYSEVFSKL